MMPHLAERSIRENVCRYSVGSALGVLRLQQSAHFADAMTKPRLSRLIHRRAAFRDAYALQRGIQY